MHVAAGEVGALGQIEAAQKLARGEHFSSRTLKLEDTQDAVAGGDIDTVCARVDDLARSRTFQRYRLAQRERLAQLETRLAHVTEAARPRVEAVDTEFNVEPGTGKTCARSPTKTGRYIIPINIRTAGLDKRSAIPT